MKKSNIEILKNIEKQKKTQSINDETKLEQLKANFLANKDKKIEQQPKNIDIEKNNNLKQKIEETIKILFFEIDKNMEKEDLNNILNNLTNLKIEIETTIQQKDEKEILKWLSIGQAIANISKYGKKNFNIDSFLNFFEEQFKNYKKPNAKNFKILDTLIDKIEKKLMNVYLSQKKEEYHYLLRRKTLMQNKIQEAQEHNKKKYGYKISTTEYEEKLKNIEQKIEELKPSLSKEKQKAITFLIKENKFKKYI